MSARSPSQLPAPSRRVIIAVRCRGNLKLLIDKILTDERWDLKFIGMQIIIEGARCSPRVSAPRR